VRFYLNPFKILVKDATSVLPARALFDPIIIKFLKLKECRGAHACVLFSWSCVVIVIRGAVEYFMLAAALKRCRFAMLGVTREV